jgi:hypothetical protein
MSEIVVKGSEPLDISLSTEEYDFLVSVPNETLVRIGIKQHHFDKYIGPYDNADQIKLLNLLMAFTPNFNLSHIESAIINNYKKFPDMIRNTNCDLRKLDIYHVLLRFIDLAPFRTIHRLKNINLFYDIIGERVYKTTLERHNMLRKLEEELCGNTTRCDQNKKVLSPSYRFISIRTGKYKNNKEETNLMLIPDTPLFYPYFV